MRSPPLLIDDSAGAVTSGNTANVSVNGGTTQYSAASVTLSTSVTAVNDAPVASVPGAQITGVNTPITLSGVNAMSVSDVDDNGGVEQITVSVANGILNLGSVAGLSTVTGNGTGSIVFTGTLVSLNNALNGLAYAPSLNYSGADTLSIATDDLGNTGAGGPLTINSTVNITVQPNQPRA